LRNPRRKKKKGASTSPFRRAGEGGEGKVSALRAAKRAGSDPPSFSLKKRILLSRKKKRDLSFRRQKKKEEHCQTRGRKP